MAVQTQLATTQIAHTQLIMAAQQILVAGSRQPISSRPAALPSAGHSLTSTYELLEQILLSLPAMDLLLSQRVNQQFASVIATSPRLQSRLFFTPKKPRTASPDFKALLNPLLTRQGTRLAIPLFFDRGEEQLRREWKQGFTRLYCHSITATTVFVYLEFSDEDPTCSPVVGTTMVDQEDKSQTAVLKTGSWERMYLAQPSCFFSWRVRLGKEGEQRVYSGIVKGERTMARLLEGLEEEVLVSR